MHSLGFQKFKKIHMIGIGGSGMIGVATILQKRGFKVTGSDLVITDELKELKKLGAKVQIGHEPRLVLKADLVVASSAISKKNPELSYAKKSGLTIIPRAEMLGTLMKPYRSIAIAGSHGKTVVYLEEQSGKSLGSSRNRKPGATNKDTRGNQDWSPHFHPCRMNSL